MKKICCLFAALLALLLSGCADVRPAPPLPSATAEYTAAWPQNALTAQIPRPDGGSVQYILDDSANGRCLIAMEGISEEETAAWVQVARTCGYAEVISETEAASTGMMFEKDGIVLSVAYSEGVLTLLIIAGASA
ncbi:MAG TPA: hypothetical protein IAA52_04305 [Candidatus Pullichristensenella stercorigallinarum]|uniref:Lipoprotein n=1 Tax=Candidatus Pullichristensenella stercorigallinarum TaxID=2840909 RepID=A0A9D0ZN14_9FIRM|nr:hypothetical protein [Candidatus Pullichristensenella stercorigallinarum]